MVVTSKPRAMAMAVAVIALVALVGCDPVVGSASGPVRHATLTSTSGMSYRYAGNAQVLYALPGTPTSDTNVREVFWYPTSRFVADQQVCATWNTVATAGSPGLLQPGLALRVAPVTGSPGGVRAITVTQNTYFGALWLFNVHIWNSADAARPLTQVAQFDLSPIVGTLLGGGLMQPRMVPAPWHVCAQTTGNRFAFKVWTGTVPEPSWSDASRVFATTLPAGWTFPGYAGGYIGHLHPRQAAAFTAMTTRTGP